MSLFPIFLKLANRPRLVVGAGRVGESKIASLLAAGAAVKVVAPEATEAVRQWARTGRIDWQARRFEPADLEGIFLAVVATASRDVNDSVFSRGRWTLGSAAASFTDMLHENVSRNLCTTNQFQSNQIMLNPRRQNSSMVETKKPEIPACLTVE